MSVNSVNNNEKPETGPYPYGNYGVLGVRRDANMIELTNAFLKVAKKYHDNPYQHETVRQAYFDLMDDKKRRFHDACLDLCLFGLSVKEAMDSRRATNMANSLGRTVPGAVGWDAENQEPNRRVWKWMEDQDEAEGLEREDAIANAGAPAPAPGSIGPAPGATEEEIEQWWRMWRWLEEQEVELEARLEAEAQFARERWERLQRAQ